MKILKTKTRILVVCQNADGTLLITENGMPIKNAGSFILNLGGINAVLEKCKDMTEEELLAEKKGKLERQYAKLEKQQQKILEKNAHIEDAYKKVFADERIVEATPYNIFILLSFLNTQNRGICHLPKMTIAYTCNQYDCNGIQATTIILDTPILYNGIMASKFQVGAPQCYFPKYHHLRFSF